MDESESVRRAQSGDRNAFRSLVDMYAERAERTARVLLHDPADAEDAVQEAWVDAWRAMPRFQVGRPFRPWLLTLVANRCHMKARKRQLHTAPYSDSIAERLGETPSWALAATDYDAELEEALDTLDEEQRKVMALRFYADLQLDEIAELTGAPLGTVKSRLHRGLAALRDRLQADGRTHREEE